MKNIMIKTDGYTGNFIQRIYNVLRIALFYNYNVILPENKLINTTYIVINKNIDKNFEKITDKNCFMNTETIENIDRSLFELNKERSIEIMKDIFVIKPDNILGKNDLLIHIRSRDLFNYNIETFYICPPLSYYVDIIEKNNYDKIYLIAEDRKNPCINKLIELYPNIIFKLQSLENDIKLILDAENIVISCGTFITSLLLLSNKCKNIYIPSCAPEWTRRAISNNINKYFIELPEYCKKIGPYWKNTPEQNELMISYKNDVN